MSNQTKNEGSNSGSGKVNNRNCGKGNNIGNGSGNIKTHFFHNKFGTSGYTYHEKATESGVKFSISVTCKLGQIEESVSKEIYDALVNFEYSTKWSNEKYYGNTTSMFDEEGNEVEYADPNAVNPSDEVSVECISTKVLCDKDRKIIKMLLDGFNQTEIGDEIGISQKAVSKRILKLREKF